jgi:hypothetical protein
VALVKAADAVRDAGFPRVAEMLDGSVAGERLAWTMLRRVKPASFGESLALDRARRAMPEELTEEGWDE